MDDEEYIYDEYPRELSLNTGRTRQLTILVEQPPIPALGWDGLNSDVDRQLVLLESQNRRRMLARGDNSRSPFPPGFMVGSRDSFGGEYQFLSRALKCLSNSGQQTSAATLRVGIARQALSPIPTMVQTPSSVAQTKIARARNAVVTTIRLV